MMLRRLTLLTTSFLILLGLLAPLPAGAIDVFQDACTKAPSATACTEKNPGQTKDDNALVGPNGIITKATQALVYAVGIISVIMVAIGGLRYTLSAGDPNTAAAAKNTILYAIVGLVVAISTELIVLFVLNSL